MSEPMNFRDRIINGVGVVPETAALLPYNDNKQFWIVEGEHLVSGSDVRFLIYNCSNVGQQFDIKEYQEIIQRESEKSLFTPVMMFQNLDQESETRTDVYKGMAKDKKLINKYFNEKIAIYTDSKEIEIEVEQEGINFLEYDTNEISNDIEMDYLNGYVYNVSYFELKKVLNVTGTKLFRENIRVGLSNNKTGKKLKKVFKDYIKVGMFWLLMKENEFENEKEKIMEMLELNDYILKMNAPDKFWFYHNGVTIFSYSDKVNRSNNRIKLNPNRISVINGAQTITNFYNAINELRPDFISMLYELEINQKCNEKWLTESLSNICKEIKIKTIIIDGSDKFINKISEGLNTQIPIEDEHILAKSDDVEKINSFLKAEGISITRDGEVSAEINLSVLEYVKKYLIIKGEPGKSKNLNKNELEALLKDSIASCEKTEFILKLKVLLELDEWWKGTRRSDLKNEKKSDIKYFKYGKNYFGSYLISKDIHDVDVENLYNLFNQFVKEFSSIKKDVELGDFKNDKLYEQYKSVVSSKILIDVTSRLESVDKEKLRNYLNENIETKYAVSKVISNYLTKEDISVPYFRVIAMNGDIIKEAYPFPNRTFAELYQNKDEEQNVAQIEFEGSEFEKEIHREFPVFIIYWNNDDKKGEDESDKVKNVDVITSFSFKDYEVQAKDVFNATKNAFEEGDDSIFTKSSDNMNFHIRPKAINSQDTFEFSNGIQITKRTFWANKETVKKIINEKQTMGT